MGATQDPTRKEGSDLSRQRGLSEELRLARILLETSHEAIVITDAKGIVVDVNQAFTTATGYTREEILGRAPRIMKSRRQGRDFYKSVWKELTETGRWEGEVWDRCKSGEIRIKWLTINAVVDEQAETTHYVAMFSDVVSVGTGGGEPTRIAAHDPLTGLANRILFQDRLQQALVIADRRKSLVALMLLDLDRFKNINDTLGHAAGDQLLVSVAARLTECVRRSDTVARVGGDEFTLILSDLVDSRGSEKIARKIVERFREPFVLDAREVFVTTSLGISIYPADAESPDMLFQHADTALYHAKEQGRNRFQFFSDDMRAQYRERMEMEGAMRSDWENGRFLVRYQPVVELSGGRVTAVQSVIQWPHSVKGRLMPAEFIPLAEEAGLVVAMGEWVLREACKLYAEWRDRGLPSIPIAVNLYIPQLKKHDFLERMDRILAETGMRPQNLRLELAESAALEDTKSTFELFTALRNRGFGVLMGSFGREYSSLGYLKHLPLDKLKLDASFVRNMVSSKYDVAIVKAVIDVAHSVNVKVIADGVESKEQFDTLLASHCDEGQGDYFSRPVAASAVKRMLKDRRKPSN